MLSPSIPNSSIAAKTDFHNLSMASGAVKSWAEFATFSNKPEAKQRVFHSREGALCSLAHWRSCGRLEQMTAFAQSGDQSNNRAPPTALEGDAVDSGLILHRSGKFAVQPERVNGPPSCDTAQCPWEIIS